MKVNINKKANERENYFKIAHKISTPIHNYIISKIKSKKLPKELGEFLLELPKKRKNGIIMRATLTYLIYKNLGGEGSIKSILPILSISELSNYYAYLDNWIFDNKNECNKDIESIKKIIIASEIFREICQECIEESDIPIQKKREISIKLAHSSLQSYTGQFKDLKLTIDKIQLFNSDSDFFKHYKKKSEDLSGFFYGLSSEIGSIIIPQPREEFKNKSRKLGNIFGTTLHMSNDLGDFSIFTDNKESLKSYKDQLADLSNERLTLPIYLTIKNGNIDESMSFRELIKNPDLLYLKINATKSLISSGSFHKIMDFLNKEERDIKKYLKQNFPENTYRKMLEALTSIITSNKYLKNLKDMEKDSQIKLSKGGKNPVKKNY
jgi:geranylgeranyl pyrophosphate synthase